MSDIHPARKAWEDFAQKLLPPDREMAEAWYGAWVETVQREFSVEPRQPMSRQGDAVIKELAIHFADGAFRLEEVGKTSSGRLKYLAEAAYLRTARRDTCLS